MRVLYIDIDTLRPDHLGCYGYSRNASPNIDEVAKEGVLFTDYYCSDAPCLPSRARCSADSSAFINEDGKNRFMHVHMRDPHMPYRVPEELG